MIDAKNIYMTPLLKDRINAALDLDGTRVRKRTGPDLTEIYDLKLGKNTLFSILWQRVYDPDINAEIEPKAKYYISIYQIYVNNVCVAKAYHLPFLYNVRDTIKHKLRLFTTEHGHDMNNILRRMEIRYENAVRAVRNARDEMKRLHADPVQTQAYVFLGQFLAR